MEKLEVLAKQFKVSPPPPPETVTGAAQSLENEEDRLSDDLSVNFDERSSPVDGPPTQSPMDRSPHGDIESGKPTSSVNHIQKAPCPCCIPAQEKKSPAGIAAATLHQCEVMAMQFVVFKPLLATAPFFVEICGYDYDGHPPIATDGNIDWFSARLYIMILGNLSVSLAFYGLLCFFHLTEKDLAWCKPWPKFLCVKGVVFMTFWQDILLQCMSGSGVVDARSAGQIQNLLICIEMFMASIAHFYIFPYEEWDSKKRKQASLEVRDTMAFYAFLSDFKRVIKGNPQQKQVDDREGSISLSPTEKIKAQAGTHEPNTCHTTESFTKELSPPPLHPSPQTPIAPPNFWQDSHSASHNLHSKSSPRRTAPGDDEIKESGGPVAFPLDQQPHSSTPEGWTTVAEESLPLRHISPPSSSRSPAVILHGSDSDSDSVGAVETEVGIQSV
jgi:hypothetical protein